MSKIYFTFLKTVKIRHDLFDSLTHSDIFED